MIGLQSTLWTLISGAREGEEEAFRAFVLRYRPPVVAYCARRGFAHEAEDLAQEVFLRIFQDQVLLKADPSKGRFRSLLFAVTRHVIGHHVEAECAQKRGGGAVRPLGDLEVPAEAEDPEFDRAWTTHLIERALSRLAGEFPHYHDALRRFLLEGETHAAIARAIAKSEGEVKNYIHRGKAKLGRYLREEVQDYSATHGEFETELRLLSRILSASDSLR